MHGNLRRLVAEIPDDQAGMITVRAGGTSSFTRLPAPPTMEMLQRGVEGQIDVIPGTRGLCFRNERSEEGGWPYNEAASEYLGQPLHGDVVILVGMAIDVGSGEFYLRGGTT